MNDTHSRLIEGYLEDLARRLGDLPGEDRMEVLDGVREHIGSALEGQADPSEAQVRAVLAELGRPEDVAQEAYAGRPGQFGAAVPGPHVGAGPHASAAPATPLASRSWVPVLVAVLQSGAVLLVLLVIGATSAFITTVEVSGSAGSTTETAYATGGTVGAMLGAGMLVLPLWIVLALFVGNSDLWVPREKVAHLLLIPMVLLLMGVLPEVGYVVLGLNGVYGAAWVGTAVSLLGGGWLLVRLTRAGRRRAAG